MPSIIFLVSTLVAALTPLSWADQPCLPESCANITIYLGPRWGSKVIHYPKLRGPGEQPNISQTVESNEPTDNNVQKIPLVYQRPVPANNLFRVDRIDSAGKRVMGVQRSMFPGSQRSPLSSTVSPEEGVGLVNMTGMRLTGEDVKLVLNSEAKLDADVMKRLVRLHLSHNNITGLPPLVFPVQLEYGLQELRLDNNPLGSINSYTRFELSRLGHLRNLSLARTGLTYMDALYLPSLEVLDLSHNHLYSLPAGLSGYTNLRELYLRGNRLYSLGENSFGSYMHLDVLDLADNHISRIHYSTFSSRGGVVSFLSVLYLNNNLLESIPDLGSVEIYNMYIGDNHFRCSCSLIYNAQRFWEKIVDRNNLTCTDDTRVEPRLVSGLTKDDMDGTCDNHGYQPRKYGWLEWLGDKCENWAYWVSSLTDWSTLFVVTAWFVVLALAFRKFTQKKTTKRVPSEMPYNILDDRQIV